VTGDPDRKKPPRPLSLLRRARLPVRRRIDYWQQSHLVRRLQAADVLNRGLLVAAVLLLCFVPFLLVLESVGGRTGASSFISRFGLSGLRDTPRRAVWLAAALGATFVGAWTQPWFDRVGGPWLISIAALPAATAFWWFSMWLLLAGKLSWRDLFPSALATGICWLGMVIVFRLTLSSIIASDYRKYGPAGVVFAIMTVLIAIGVVVILGALLGVAWREREEHPPGEQPAPSGHHDRLLRSSLLVRRRLVIARVTSWYPVPRR
jgi:membrane protein